MVVDEGRLINDVKDTKWLNGGRTLRECHMACQEDIACNSLRYCGKTRQCKLYDKEMNGNELLRQDDKHDDCFTSFKTCGREDFSNFISFQICITFN